eukprot:m.316851 g.316851  ORF g.316851 m.316851 type:complete len:96 (-) comp19682_c0_seq3:1753-2040(-)
MAHLAHGVALTHVDEGVTVPLPALPACGKLVVFIRHGQSIANTVGTPQLTQRPNTNTLHTASLAFQNGHGCLGTVLGGEASVQVYIVLTGHGGQY